MKELKTKEDFLNLEISTRITLIKDGQCRSYRFVGQHPVKICKDLFIVVSDSNLRTAETFNYPSSDTNFKWYLGYDSKTAGKEIISQIEKEIEVVKEVYFGNNNQN